MELCGRSVEEGDDGDAWLADDDAILSYLLSRVINLWGGERASKNVL